MIARLQRFAAAGVATTLLYVVLAVSFESAGLAPVKASITAYGLSAGFSYLAQRRAFSSKDDHMQAAPRFLASTLLGLAVATLISSIAAGLGFAPSTGYVVVCLLIPPLNFVLFDRVVFRSKA